MKQITTILLIIIALSCSGQQPDTLTYYSVEYVDSIKADYQLRIDILSSVLQSNTFETNEDSCKLVSDDGNIRAEIIKKGSNVWVNIINGDKRINSDYIDSESRVMIMNDTVTIGSMFINSDNSKGISYIEL